jgi:hypothetical protein
LPTGTAREQRACSRQIQTAAPSSSSGASPVQGESIVLRLAVLLALIVLAHAGVAAAALTPTQYQARAAAVCKATSAKLKTFGSPKTKDEFVVLIKKAVPVFRTQYSKLKALEPAANLRPLHVKVLGLEKKQLDEIQKFLDQVDGGADIEKAYRALDAKLSTVSDAEAATWKKLRVPACANL